MANIWEQRQKYFKPVTWARQQARKHGTFSFAQNIYSNIRGEKKRMKKTPTHLQYSPRIHSILTIWRCLHLSFSFFFTSSTLPNITISCREDVYFFYHPYIMRVKIQSIAWNSAQHHIRPILKISVICLFVLLFLFFSSSLLFTFLHLFATYTWCWNNCYVLNFVTLHIAHSAKLLVN